MSERAIDVAIVEDNVFFRDTLAELFVDRAGIRCGFAVDSCEAALAALTHAPPPNVLLMDLELPGMTGIEGIRRIKGITPATQIVVLTVHEDHDRVFEALCAGACGYLVKPSTADRIIEAVETAVSGGAPMNAFIARKVLDVFLDHARPKADYALTGREREILHLLVDAHSQKQIAHALSLSPHTVDTHLRNIYAKLHVHSRAGAVAKALQERLI